MYTTLRMGLNLQGVVCVAWIFTESRENIHHSENGLEPSRGSICCMNFYREQGKYTPLWNWDWTYKGWYMLHEFLRRAGKIYTTLKMGLDLQGVVYVAWIFTESRENIHYSENGVEPSRGSICCMNFYGEQGKYTLLWKWGWTLKGWYMLHELLRRVGKIYGYFWHYPNK